MPTPRRLSSAAPTTGVLSALARLALLTLAALALGSCAAEPEPEPERDLTADRERTAVEGELDAVYDAFSRAYRESDVQMLMDSVYGDSAFYLPPGSPILRGQDQFRGQFSFLERFARLNRRGPAISFEIVDRDISGDLAYDIGVYTLRTPGSSADAPETRGKFIVVWKRGDDGRWRMHADAFSPLE